MHECRNSIFIILYISRFCSSTDKFSVIGTADGLGRGNVVASEALYNIDEVEGRERGKERKDGRRRRKERREGRRVRDPRQRPGKGEADPEVG